jgi:hypothetical protein
MPRTYATKPRAAINFWKRKRLRPDPIDLLPIIARKARYFFEDVPPSIGGQIIQADSRHIGSQLSGRRFQWVITSPPYLGMRTYIPDQWIRNWFMGGTASVDYRGIDQLGMEGRTNFTAALASVWKEITPFCSDGARLVVRFGALPSLRINAREVLRDSLSAVEGWRVLTIKDAGRPPKGRRQASQFRRAGRGISEIDLHAVLEK